MPDAYPWATFVLAVGAMALGTVYLYRVANAYRFYHDERAAVSLAKAVGLFVVALGLLISATGYLWLTEDLRAMGLSIARGSLVVLLATLVIADVRPGDDRPS